MTEPGADVHDLVARRQQARQARDFAEADRLRDQVRGAGWLLRDTPAGPELVPAPPYALTDPEQIAFEMFGIAYGHGLKVPGELSLLAKALFNLDSVTRTLDPEFVPANAINSYLTQIATQRAKSELAPARLFQLASQTTQQCFPDGIGASWSTRLMRMSTGPMRSVISARMRAIAASESGRRSTT